MIASFAVRLRAPEKLIGPPRKTFGDAEDQRRISVVGDRGVCSCLEAPMPVRVEKQGSVTTVILDRPDVRNAVDRVAAQALADAFRGFDADPEARAAVPWGSGGTFCSGADQKAIAAGEPNRVAPDGDGPCARLAPRAKCAPQRMDLCGEGSRMEATT
jgi:hypothetical protein